MTKRVQVTAKVIWATTADGKIAHYIGHCRPNLYMKQASVNNGLFRTILIFHETHFGAQNTSFQAVLAEN